MKTPLEQAWCLQCPLSKLQNLEWFVERCWLPQWGWKAVNPEWERWFIRNCERALRLKIEGNCRVRVSVIDGRRIESEPESESDDEDDEGVELTLDSDPTDY
jgi:hypothetical protein